MLQDKDVMATIPVKDMAAAREFYEHRLGFEKTSEMGADVITYRSGSSAILVYRSDYAGSNQATAATWGVGKDFDSIMDALRKAGVAFEHYDNFPTEEDVAVFGDFKGAWFKDPSGNILHINSA